MNSNLIHIETSVAKDIITFNRVLKGNVLMYLPNFNSLVGFGSDIYDANILKVVNKPISLQDIPGWVFLAKDLSALITTAEKEDIPIMGRLDYTYYPNVFISEIWCGNSIKPCYSVFPFFDKYMNVINETSDSNIISRVDNIQDMIEFRAVFTAKANDGVITIPYNGIVYFIPVMGLGILKKDKVSIIVYKGMYNIDYLVDFKITRGKIIKDIYYRMGIV